MINISSTIQKSTDILVSNIDDEAVILGVEIGKYIGLNAIGTEIWSRIDEPVKVSVLIDELASSYNEDIEIIKNQVIEFLNNLIDKSIIRVIDEA